jgi:phosphatidylserine/phosphatidylglycerophosphate/cardiolipin synthase-like enzyme
LIDREPAQGRLIDVDILVTLARPVDALIRAAARGVRIRMYLEPNEHANSARREQSPDGPPRGGRRYPGTIEIRMRKHLGSNHQKTIWLHAQHVVVFGTSNWSDASTTTSLKRISSPTGCPAIR